MLQLAAPAVLIWFGLDRVALWTGAPGLLPILWMTGGWFAGLSVTGLVLMTAINSIFYAALLHAFVRIAGAARQCVRTVAA